MTKEAGATEISSDITTFGSGTSNSTRHHNAEESVIVIEGEGILMITVKRTKCASTMPPSPRLAPTTGNTPFKIAWSYATVDVSRPLVED